MAVGAFMESRPQRGFTVLSRRFSAPFEAFKTQEFGGWVESTGPAFSRPNNKLRAKPIATPRRASVGFVSLSPPYKIVVPCLTAVAHALASTACAGFNGAGVFHDKKTAQHFDINRMPLEAKCCRAGAADRGFARIRAVAGSRPSLRRSRRPPQKRDRRPCRLPDRAQRDLSGTSRGKTGSAPLSQPQRHQ